MTRDWDAATYDRVSAPQVEWAERVLERLAGRGDETVLDAAALGRVTKMLPERLPRGHVVAVDSAESMVEHAREALDPERATVFQADLTELELDEPVDAAFSNAVFHWIPDHERCSPACTPRCGRAGCWWPSAGQGEREALHAAATEVAAEEPYAEYLRRLARTLELRGAEETAERLERAGFTDIETWLEPYPVSPPDPTGFLHRNLPRAPPRPAPGSFAPAS